MSPLLTNVLMASSWTLPRKNLQLSRVHGRCRLAGLPLLAFFIWISAGSLRSAEVSKEYQVKAVLLFNLARFVDWPPAAFANSNSPVVIGIVGRDPLGRALDDAVQGEEVKGRKIIVERYSAPGAIKACHILFISSSERARVKEILAAQKNRPVLTVSEIDNFATLPGGMVTLYINDQKKPRVRVNAEAAKAENLQVSSKLLQVAEVTSK